MSGEGEILNPLDDVPVVGWAVRMLDEAIAQTGIPMWLRAAVELVVTGIVGYQLLKLVVNRVVPWAGLALVRPVVALMEAVRASLLLPDFAVSTAVRRFGRVPPEPVHTYGQVVTTVVDGAQNAVRTALPKLVATRRTPKALLMVLLVVGFLAWNSQACDSKTACLTPVTAWTTSFDAWWGGIFATS